MPSFRPMLFAAASLFLMAGSASAEDSRAVKFAKLGVQLAGYNYVSYVKCQAPADKLHLVKEKARTRFPAAGSGFDALFAAGQAEGAQQWARGAADLHGEDKERAAVCPNALKRLDANLARK